MKKHTRNSSKASRNASVAAVTTRLLAIAPFVLALAVGTSGCRDEAEGEAVGGRVVLARGSGGGAPPAEFRRLWAGPDFNFFASSPSPDGRFVTEIDWNTGDLAVRDLTTGAVHHLTDKGPWETSADYAEVARFTPDGRHVLYGWYNDSTGAYEMRLLDFALDESGIPQGSNERVVHDGTGQEVYWLYDWRSSDEILTGIYRPDQSTALAFLTVSTGELRVVKSFDWRDAHGVLSHDGRFIAYDHPDGQDPRDRDIHVLSADGSSELPLVNGPGKDVVLGWVPGDSSLLFYSERSGTPSVWRLPMADGQPAGDAMLVREDVRNLEPLGFAGDVFYFGVEVESPTFRTATIDYAQRRLVQKPAVFDVPWGGTMITALAWSPDGSHVIHTVETTGRPSTRMFLRTADGEAVREWNFELRIQRRLIRWMPDGQSVLVVAHDAKGRLGFFRMDLESGELELVHRIDSEAKTGVLFSISPDGRSLYFTRIAGNSGDGGADRTIEIVSKDLETGAVHAIHTVNTNAVHLGASHWSPIAPTPDGKSLAYSDPGDAESDWAIRIVPADGGSARTLYTVRRPAVLHGIIGWEPNGPSLLFLVLRTSVPESWSTADVELWRVLEDGRAEKIGEIKDYAGGADLSPDGRTLAYRAGRTRGEIWAIDGLVGNVARAADGRMP